MSLQTAVFAVEFEAALKKEGARVAFTEVEQFRAMMRAFRALTSTFYLEEFHGFKRQVYFDTVRPWMRRRARCELCDVLFVVYSRRAGLEVRMTLLQAKLSRDVHCTSLPVYKGRIEPQSFHANYEQWDLLSRRPKLHPTGVFEPPPELLSSALLSSVGTFGIFFRSPNGAVDLFYVSADRLRPKGTPSGPNARLGKLQTKRGFATRSISAWKEVTYCPSSREFAASLYRLEIGTPILKISSGGVRHGFDPQLDWVRQVIATHMAATDTPSPISREILIELGTTDPFPAGTSLPSLVVLRGE